MKSSQKYSHISITLPQFNLNGFSAPLGVWPRGVGAGVGPETLTPTPWGQPMGVDPWGVVILLTTYEI